MNRFCSYLWVFEQAHADKTRSAFDKSQTTDIVAVCVAPSNKRYATEAMLVQR
jgi:hypothetical protein